MANRVKSHTLSPIALFSRQSSENDETESGLHPLEMPQDQGATSKSLSALGQDLRGLHEKWHAVEKEIIERDETVANLQKTMQQARDDLEQSMAEYEGRIAEVERDYDALLQEKNVLEHQLASHSDSAASDKETISKLEAQNVELRVQLNELQDYIDGRKDDWEQRKATLKEYEDTIEGMRSSYAAHDKVVAAVEEEKAALAHTVMELERELAELKGRHRERDEIASALRGEIGESSRKLVDVTARATEHEIRAAELQAMLLESEAEQKSLEAELEAQRELVETLEKELSGKQGEPESRNLDMQIDDLWLEHPRKSVIDAAEVFESQDEEIMLPAEELFDVGDQLAEHTLVAVSHEGQELAEYPLRPGEMVIGRSEYNDIHLDSKFVSRKHAKVRVSGDTVIIEDAGSMNGFFVNDVRTQLRELNDGDEVEIGDRKLRYRHTPA